MNKEIINKYINNLYLKSKNDLRKGCSLETLSNLLCLEKNTNQNILHYLSEKGYINTKNNYGDNVSLTTDGFDFVEKLRESKQFKTIKFRESRFLPPASEMKYGFLFWYDLIDENNKIEYNTIGVFASDVLSMNWQLHFDESNIINSEKILLQFAKDYIIKKNIEETLNKNEELNLRTSSQPPTCPFIASNLIPTKSAEYEIDLSEIKNIILVNEEPRNITQEIINDNPTVFISYSWDDEYHKEWVLNLTRKLFDKGIKVLLDVYELAPGKNMIHFMESSIPNASKVLIIFTPNYKLKAEKRQGGVGFEYSILNAELYNKIISNNKYIPILKSGNFLDSIPAFMQQFIAIDMTKENDFDDRLNELVHAIYNKPKIEKPILGINPFKI